MQYLIRKATPNDSENITRAILSAGGNFLPWLFGPRFQQIIYDATNSENCSFSWINTIVCEINNTVAGVVVCYPSEKEKEMDAGLSVILKRYFTFFSFLKFLRRARKAVKYFRKPKNSYYVLAIAVFDIYQRRGVAKSLLSHVEEKARAGGYTSIALEVESYNVPATTAYLKQGFEKRYEIPIKNFSRVLAKDRHSSMWLMRKKLN